MAVGSPFVTEHRLDRYGLAWAWPEIDCVHPLDDGTAGVLHRSVERTAADLGADGRRWSALFGGPSRSFDALADDIMAPLLRIPRHPVALARFGAPTVLPASTLARVFAHRAGAGAVRRGRRARVPAAAPPADQRDRGRCSSPPGTRTGGRSPRAARGAIAGAMAAGSTSHGGKIETGVRVDVGRRPAARGRPDARRAADAVARHPRRPAAATRSPAPTAGSATGPGAFKVDFAIDGGVPWTDRGRAPRGHRAPRRQATRRLVATEQRRPRGRMPERPFVLVGQQYLADPSRSAGDIHPLWTYAHVPNGYTGDATEAIIAPDRAVRPRLPRPGRRHVRALDHRDGGVQPQLRRW